MMKIFNINQFVMLKDMDKLNNKIDVLNKQSNKEQEEIIKGSNHLLEALEESEKIMNGEIPVKRYKNFDELLEDIEL